ncbi:hypothetical protein KNP414_07296 [Paenibacillus mucilaginosus KNP414]|uniref:Uncharacterized protein n=1 Tax=Paenibacillus mucilaginosus (strain KNP414) TaxID=1036673 RepID=F8FP27_PAEMK|nr:hypothetical protein KNP414_07296 [Paenibacillus mucilaginosus KNP414]
MRRIPPLYLKTSTRPLRVVCLLTPPPRKLPARSVKFRRLQRVCAVA